MKSTAWHLGRYQHITINLTNTSMVISNTWLYSSVLIRNPGNWQFCMALGLTWRCWGWAAARRPSHDIEVFLLFCYRSAGIVNIPTHSLIRYTYLHNLIFYTGIVPGVSYNLVMRISGVFCASQGEHIENVYNLILIWNKMSFWASSDDNECGYIYRSTILIPIPFSAWI